jgi:uncharacterized protein (DUF1800 family)
MKAATRHLLNRFSYSATPELGRQLESHGGGARWLEHQFEPGNIADHIAGAMWSWFPDLAISPTRMGALKASGQLNPADVMADLARWTLLRRIYSHQQVHEVMTDFWSNLLHITSPSDKAWPYRVTYDQTIRRHALGRFDSMLYAAITHPAMGCYLDNAKSTARNPNENLGRELLELHTVGRLAGYSEHEVVSSAYILTGWHVDMFNTWKASYRPEDHFVGKVSVLGFSRANKAKDGRPLTKDYLHYLAHHPATARRIALKLATRFISDAPSDKVVSDLARVFSRSGTDIKSTLRALSRHPEFLGSAGRKVRTPTEDIVATMRAIGVKARKPSGKETDFALALLWESEAMGQKPFAWTRPDGFPDVADAWSSVSRILGSWQVHYNAAGAWYPKTAVRFRTVHEWLPRLPARFDAVVDHVCRRVITRPASNALLGACCAATGIRPHERIHAGHPLLTFKFPRMLHTVLDSPSHMTR